MYRSLFITLTTLLAFHAGAGDIPLTINATERTLRCVL